MDRSRPARERSAEPRRRPPVALLVALVLACACLMVLDHDGDRSPVSPVRRAAGEVLGPIEVAVAGMIRPVVRLPGWVRSNRELTADLAAAEQENARLRSELAGSGFDRNRLDELEGLTSVAGTLGHALVPARVVAVGPRQSFSRTVTIDAGSAAGVHADQTVVNADGLVGRVLSVTRTTATVLLIVDADSIVGGRLGESMELGFLHGRGILGEDGRLDLELLDSSLTPAEGDVVVTWGSENDAPYVSGIPVGTVTKVFSNLANTSRRAVIAPYADFSSLDLVGVVVPSGTRGDRGVIEANGEVTR